MRDGQTYYQGEEYFLKTVNYMISMHLSENGELIVGPASNYLCWGNEEYPTTQVGASKFLRSHFKMIKDMGFNSIRLMNATVQHRWNSGELAVRLWLKNQMYFAEEDQVREKRIDGFNTYEHYESLSDNGTEYVKQTMQIVLDIAKEYDLKVIWVTGDDTKYVENGVTYYKGIFNDYNNPNSIEYYSFLEEISIEYKNHSALFAYDICNEGKSFENEEMPDGAPVNRISLSDNVKLINENIKINTPNQYTTVGLFSLDSFFKLGVKPFFYCDIISFHLYSGSRYDNLDLDYGDPVNLGLHYINKTVEYPWMVGENGIETPAQTNLGEMCGTDNVVSESEQIQEVASILNYSSRCGALGYSYWMFANLIDSQNFGLIKGKWGSYNYQFGEDENDVYPINSSYKEIVNPPDSSMFNTFEVQSEVCTFAPNLYYDIFQTQPDPENDGVDSQYWDGTVNSGGQGVVDAIAKIRIDAQDYFTFTRSDGSFSITTPTPKYDPFFPTLNLAEISVTKYGYDTYVRPNVISNGVFSTNFDINPVVYPSKTQYTYNYVVNEGESSTISEQTMITGHVYVYPGATLTINCPVFFNDNSQIKVYPGGKLILEDGAVLTAIHQSWYGVVLNGDELGGARPEIISSGNTTIAKAHTGIYNYLNPVEIDDFSDVNIDLNGTKFINNYQDIFINRNRGNTLNFRNCDFTLTADALEQFSVSNDCDEFIEINLSDHAKFVNCHFADNRNYSSSVPEKVGIETINLKKLEVLPDPYMGARRSTFTNLYYGIKATSGWGGELNIRNCEFTTVRGVYLEGYASFEPVVIVNSTFNILDYAGGDKEDVPPDGEDDENYYRPYGVYLDNTCDAYQIEGNIFKSENGIPDDKYGLIANSNGQLSNQFYRNKFYDLENAVQAIGLNRNLTADYTNGLQVLCNKFYNTKTDVFVNSEIPYGGIAKNQGSLTIPASNLFTSGAVLCNYKNELSHIDYFVRNPDDPNFDNMEIPYSVEGDIYVIPLDIVTTDEACPIYSLDIPDHFLVDEMYQELESSAMLEISITSMLDDIVDGGSTGQVLSDIIHLEDNSAWVTYYDLMYNSPYLSDTVLKNVSKKETGLTVPMIRDILVANPQSAKNSDLKKLLEDRNDQLPDYMIEQIEAGETYVSAKENLEIQRSEQRVIYDKSLKKLIGYYYELEDSLPYAEDSIVSLLKRRNEAPYYFELTEYYFNKLRYLEAKEVLNSMYAVCELTDMEIIEIEDLISFINFYKNLLFMNKNSLYNLPDFYIEQLKVIEDKGGRVGAKAHVILLLNNASDYREIVYKPEEVFEERKIESDYYKDANPAFSVYPNPAKEHINVEYKLIEQKGVLQFVITDVKGQIVLQKQLCNLQDIVIVKISDLPEGTYNCSLYNGSKLEFNEKLIIDN